MRITPFACGIVLLLLLLSPGSDQNRSRDHNCSPELGSFSRDRIVLASQNRSRRPQSFSRAIILLFPSCAQQGQNDFGQNGESEVFLRTFPLNCIILLACNSDLFTVLGPRWGAWAAMVVRTIMALASDQAVVPVHADI